jgi:hypothetical protein
LSAIAVRAQDRIRLAARPDTAASAALAVVFALLLALTWGTWGDPGSDTGYDVVAGSLVAHGHLPYADFTYYYGPLAPAVLGFAAWIGGDGLQPAIVVGLLLTALIVALAFVVGRLLAGPVGGLLAGALTAGVAFAPTNFSYVLPHASSEPLGLLTTLGVLAAVGYHARRGGAAWLLAAGAAVGLACLTRPEFAVAAVAAAGAYLVLRLARGLSRLPEVAFVAAPAVLLPAAVYSAFLTRVSLHALTFDNLYPREQLRAGGDAVVRLSAPLTVSSLERPLAALALFAAGFVLLRAVRTAGRGQALLLGAFAIAAVASVLAAREQLRYGLELAYGWIPLGAVVAFVVLLRRARREPPTPRLQLELAACVALAVVAAKTYAAFYLFSTVPQSAAYAAPLAAVFLVALHLRPGARYVANGVAWLTFLALTGAGLTVHDAAAQSGRVAGPGGWVGATPAEARLYSGALSWIEAAAPIGGPVLLAPQLTVLYPLSERRDPMPQISLLPSALPRAADERAAIAVLSRERVPLIVTDRHRFPEYGYGSFGRSFDRILAAWIRTHYIHARTVSVPGLATHELDIWLRRET